MKTVYSNAELPHVWRHETELHAARNPGGSMSFRGDNFYSYRTIVAKRIKDQLIMSRYNYSTTTAKHKSLIARAFGGDYITVECVQDTPEQNYKALIRNVMEAMAKQSRARKRDYLSAARAELKDFKKYAALVGFKFKAETIDDLIALDTKLKAKAEAAARRELKDFKKVFTAAYITRAYNIARDLFHSGRHEATRRAIMRKLQGLNDTARRLKVPAPVTNLAPDFMRVKDGGVITTQGVNITRGEASILFRAIKAGVNPEGQSISRYTIEHWGDDTVKIGCHIFPRSEFGYISRELFGEAV